MQWNMGLDIGASGVRMAIKGRGVLYRQSSAIAIGASDAPIAYGNEALRMLGRTPEGIRVGFPMDAGTVQDEALLVAWLTYLFRHASVGGLVRRPRVLLCYPPALGNYPMKLMASLAMEAGAGSCTLVRSDAAAALGAPLDILKPSATLVAELGAGGMCATLFGGGRVVRSQSLPFGMRRVDEQIMRHMRREHGIALGPRQAEDVKISLVGASAAAAPRAALAALDAKTGFPRMFEVEAKDVKQAAQIVTAALVELIHQVVEGAPVELSADLNDNGVVLTGGGAQLYGLPALIAEQLGLPCHLPEDPGASVARGLLKIMASEGRYEHLTTAHTNLMERRLPGR